MSEPFRPTNHAEREQALTAVRRYLTTPGIDQLVVIQGDRHFVGPSAAYEATGQTYRRAKGRAQGASLAADKADERFDTALRGFAGTLKDAQNRSRASELKPLLGGLTVGEVTDLPYRQEVSAMKSFFEQLPERPDLTGGAAELAALQAPVVALEAAVDLDEQETRAFRGATTAFHDATDAWDKGYAKLRRVLKPAMPQAEFETMFPKFVRTGAGNPPPGDGA